MPPHTKPRRNVPAILVAAILLGNAAAFAQKLHIPASTRHTLDNGLTVILMEYRKVPVVHFRLVVKGGSAGDPTGKEGTAAITTSLMREGTVQRTATQLAEQIDFLGGTLSAAAGLDYCAVNCQVLSKDAAAGLGLFAEIILHPVFPQEELERERKQRLANIDALKENQASIAGVAFARAAYGTHPYGRQSFGTRQSLASITRDDLVGFHRSTFVPGNATLVVVGDFASGRMLEDLQAAFAGWLGREGTATTMSAATPVEGRHVVFVDKPDATQTQIQVGNTAVDMRHPDNFAIEVANGVLGNGFTSRLVEELRVKRSLTYGAGSSFTANMHGGLFRISTFTKNETLVQTLDVILDEVRKFREHGATREELEKSCNYLSGNFARSLQRPEALAANITDIEVYGLPQDYLTTYVEKLRAVSLEEVGRVARNHFPIGNLVVVLVGPASTAREAVGKYGHVQVIGLDDAIQ